MSERIFYPNMIIVGGTGRKSGKTSFVCGLIEKFSGELQISGLKVSAVFPGEKEFHGSHAELKSAGIQVFRENNPGGEKDTSRMLIAGAIEAWFLSAADDKIFEGFDRLMPVIDKESVIVCESNSLAKIVKPGLFVMIKRNDQKPFKNRVIDLERFADMLVDFDDGSFATAIGRIKYGKQGWFLSE